MFFSINYNYLYYISIEYLLRCSKRKKFLALYYWTCTTFILYKINIVNIKLKETSCSVLLNMYYLPLSVVQCVSFQILSNIIV